MVELRNLRRTLCGVEEIEHVPEVWNKIDLVDLVLRDVDGVVGL